MPGEDGAGSGQLPQSVERKLLQEFVVFGVAQRAFAEEILPAEEETAVARHSMLVVDARREQTGLLGLSLGYLEHGRGFGGHKAIPYGGTEVKIGRKVDDKQVDQRQRDQRDEGRARQRRAGRFAAPKSRAAQYGEGQGDEQRHTAGPEQGRG